MEKEQEGEENHGIAGYADQTLGTSVRHAKEVVVAVGITK